MATFIQINVTFFLCKSKVIVLCKALSAKTMILDSFNKSKMIYKFTNSKQFIVVTYLSICFFCLVRIIIGLYLHDNEKHKSIFRHVSISCNHLVSINPQ